MKPAEFDYYAPTSVSEALDLLAELGYDVKVLAGGQSLVAAMNFRMAVPPALLDLTRIPELVYIHETEEGGLAIGAMTTDTAVERDERVKQLYPVITDSMPHIAHPQIRNRGTFGGAVAHADPTGQLPAVVLALNVDIKILNKESGERIVPIDEFFLGPFTTAIDTGDLLVEVILPKLPARTGTSYQQMARQKGAQALVGVASVVTLDEAGQVVSARIGMCSVGETPVLALAAAEKLIGREPTEDVIAEAAAAAAEVDIDPPGDIQSTPEYRRHLTRVMVARSLTQAVERAKA